MGNWKLRRIKSAVNSQSTFSNVYAGVTQLVESQPSKLLVAGSSPVSRSERIEIDGRVIPPACPVLSNGKAGLVAGSPPQADVSRSERIEIDGRVIPPACPVLSNGKAGLVAGSPPQADVSPSQHGELEIGK